MTVQVEDARSTREEILDAGERLFSERGFAGVSMRDIAAATSLRNQASLYYHFRNKRGLYEAVLARGLDYMISLLPSPPESARLGANIDRLLDYLSKHPHLARLIQRAALDDSRYLQDAVRKIVRPLYTEGRRALAGAEEIWEADEIPHLAAGIYHLIFGYFANAALFEAIVMNDPLQPEALDRQRRFVKRAVGRLLGVEDAGHDERNRA